MTKKQGISIVLLIVTYMFACIYWQFINTIIISFGVEAIKATTVEMASVGAMVAFASLLTRPFGGIISDRLYEKNIYFISLLVLFVSGIGFVFCKAFQQLYFFQIIRGVVWTFFNIAGQCMIARISSTYFIGRAISLYMLGASIANIFTGAFAIDCVNRFGYRYAFMIASLFTILAAVLTLFIQFEKTEKNKAFRTKISLESIFSIKIIHIVLISVVFQIMVIAFGGGFVTAFSRSELGIENVGLFMAVSGVAGIFGRLMYGKIYDSKGILLVIVMCMAGNALAALIMANATAYKHIIAAAFIIGLFTTGSSAALQADAVKCLGKERAGVATSSRSIGNDIGYMLGSMVVAGFVEKYGTYKTSYMCMFFLSIISIVLFVVYYKRKA